MLANLLHKRNYEKIGKTNIDKKNIRIIKKSKKKIQKNSKKSKRWESSRELLRGPDGPASFPKFQA